MITFRIKESLKLKTLTTIVLLLTIQVGFTQSIATNIFFDNAFSVYKGRVESTVCIGSDGEGHDFTIFTNVEKIYKGDISNDRIGLRSVRLYDFEIGDTSIFEITPSEFPLTKDSTYIFFIRFPPQNNFADLLDVKIEGIPFTPSLENELLSFRKYEFYCDEYCPQLAFHTLLQSSPVVTEGKVIKIRQSIGYYPYEIEIESPDRKKMTIKASDLNCICKEGYVRPDKHYLFFLTPVSKKNYLLTDRWLGIFELNSNILVKLKMEQKRASYNQTK